MKIERLLKAIANPRRLEIVRVLHERGELSVSQISDKLRLSFKATSKHLQILVQADIVDRRQESLMMFYQLVKPIHPIIRTVVSHL